MLLALEGKGSRVEFLTPRKQHVCAAIERGGFGLFHLVAHGSFGGTPAADASAVLFDDGLFTAAELSPRMVAALRSTAPLFFFNACQSGRIGFSLTRMGSWGARLIEFGCGGFIGPLWQVTDAAALVFARSFYEAMMAGATIGEAMLKARCEVRQRFPNDPTWLAYCCFADPLARVRRTTNG
jgi:CHAT domain-containing protein